MQRHSFNRQCLHLHRRSAESARRQGGRGGRTCALAEQRIAEPDTRYKHHHQDNADAGREQLSLARPGPPVDCFLAR
jgi:hypothetical protein